MYSTISTEGSDSFDAISRSYSYVYQAPWHYLWYGLVAIAYGAILVFFVGLMGSLMVYLGKWGVERAPVLDTREPTYLFRYAPTSYGWRDLLLYKQPDTETVTIVHHNGAVGPELTLSPSYKESMSWSNYIGAIMVSVWIYILFLMVVGFAYSYFWCASTIIYLLMRRKVDDTEMDEVHLEEEEFEEPLPKSAPAAAPPAAPAPAGGRTMVEAPTLRTPSAPAAPATTVPPTAPPNVVVTPPPAVPVAPINTVPKTQLAPEPPVSTAPKTQLASEPLIEGKDGASALGKPPETTEPPTSLPESSSNPPPSVPPSDEGKP